MSTTYEGIMRSLLNSLGKLLMASFVGSATITLISLARVYSSHLFYSVPWEGRGFPFYFLITTYYNSPSRLLVNFAPPVNNTVYSILIPSLIVDLVIWFLVVLAILLIVRLSVHKTL